MMRLMSLVSGAGGCWTTFGRDDDGDGDDGDEEEVEEDEEDSARGAEDQFSRTIVVDWQIGCLDLESRNLKDEKT